MKALVFVVTGVFANQRPQSVFSGSVGVPFSRPGLTIPRQRVPSRSRMASLFRGHRALARREASLRAEAPAGSLVRVGRAGFTGIWSRLRTEIPPTKISPLFPSLCHKDRVSVTAADVIPPRAADTARPAVGGWFASNSSGVR